MKTTTRNSFYHFLKSLCECQMDENEMRFVKKDRQEELMWEFCFTFAKIRVTGLDFSSQKWPIFGVFDNFLSVNYFVRHFFRIELLLKENLDAGAKT